MKHNEGTGDISDQTETRPQMQWVILGHYWDNWRALNKVVFVPHLNQEGHTHVNFSVLIMFCTSRRC